MTFTSFIESFHNSYYLLGFVILQVIFSLVLLLCLRMRQMKREERISKPKKTKTALNNNQSNSFDANQNGNQEAQVPNKNGNQETQISNQKGNQGSQIPKQKTEEPQTAASTSATADKNSLNKGPNRQIIIERIKKSLGKKNILKPTDQEVINNYSFDRQKSPHPRFDLWDINDNESNELYKFGIRVLQHYAEHKTPKQYLKIATDIVERIKTRIDLIVLSPSRDLFSDFIFTASYMLRLLAIYEFVYEFVADSKDIKGPSCHPYITKMVPNLRFAVKASADNQQKVVLMIPLLLSNFLFDEKTFEADKQSEEIKMLHAWFSVKSKLSDGDIATELYIDGSRIIYNVASYHDLLPVAVDINDTFVDDMYIALGFRSDSRKIIDRTLQKLLHPTIRYHIVDLFSLFTHEIMNDEWFNVNPDESGVHIFPLMGVGVFKTPQRLFTIRIFKSRINTFRNEKNFLGLMQLREIYEQDGYYDYATWDLVKKAPGVVSIDKTSGPDNEETYKIIASKSYIGKLINQNVLFWSNRYEVSKPYKSEIWEIGVFSDGGLVSSYRIQNKDTRKLVFQSFVDGRAEFVEAGTSVDSVLKKVISEGKLASEVKFLEDSNLGIQFEYERDVYEVGLIDEVTFIVKCNNVAILGGKCGGDLMDDINHDGRVFRRKTSFMYEPLQT